MLPGRLPFTHDPHHEDDAAGHGHIVGPDLVPHDW
jgi:hypothetical protein